ncbi:MAG: methyltransferase domain-containing protein [Actinomycetota bacterium]|nr:methyltransferase domain-containing protein [Actinomycetota bacterium]
MPAGPRLHHPNEAPKNRLAYRTFEAALAYAAERYARGRLVDVGAGTKPWQPLFAPHVSEHVGVDHVQKQVGGVDRVDVIASAYDVPLPDRHSATVLLSEVLEHLERPEDALRECFRLLEPGGHVIVTTPFFWPVHDERDFFRYAPGGLRYLLDATGFELVELLPLGGAWTTMSLELGYALERFRRGPATPLVDGVTVGAQWLAERLERLDFQPKFSWNHLVVGRRPEAR